MAVTSSKSVIVIAPGSPAELIQELLGSQVLPGDETLEVFLPPGDTRPYKQLLDQVNSSGRAQFFSSPGSRFFSISHLNWLRANLKTTENNMLLVVESPYQDPITALICLTVLSLSGKTITLLFATPEAVIDLTGQGFSERWLSQPLNLKVLAGELSRIFWFLNPWNILYFLMFGGLIVRQYLSNYLTKHKKVHKN